MCSTLTLHLALLLELMAPLSRFRARRHSLFGLLATTPELDTWYIAAPGIIISSASVRSITLSPRPGTRLTKISTGKDTSTTRLTYILRPYPATAIPSAPFGLETPPVTDLESSLDPESDFAFSDVDRSSHRSAGSDVDSDFEGAANPPGAASALSDIAESMPVSPHLGPADMSTVSRSRDGDDAWSATAGDDADSDFDGGDELARSVSTLDLDEDTLVDGPEPRMNVEADADADVTLRAPLRLRQSALTTSRLWEHHRRSASSPSRSPVRRPPPRVHPRGDPPRARQQAKRPPVSFYDYLFS